MISQEMLALGRQGSIIRAIFEYGNRRKAEIGADQVFDFSLGNPGVPAPESVADAIRTALAETDPIALHGYTSAPGSMQARSAIAASIKERFGVPSTPDCIYMTAGAAASLTITLKALLLPGEEVLVPVPYFPEYRTFIENAGGKLTPIAPDDRMFPDLADLEAKLTPNVKAIILNSPNNPSGAVYSTEVIEQITTLLKRKSNEFGAPIYLISDEPYRELVWSDAQVPYLPCYYDHSVVCYSYSKSLSLPGERIGYIALSPTMEDRGEVFAAVCGAGRSLGFVCAPSLFQAVAAKCTTDHSDFSVYIENRNLLLSALTEYGFACIPPDGAFYLFMKSPEPDAYAFYERAKQHELLLVPSDDFGVGGYVRISYCVTTEQIKRSLPALRKLAKEYGLC
ncbi:MAG: pyridoxal phosphate-dependent aminotransferase [Clostridia bacterium]|nr:pyridoxal phosphate-dependent aminotransferase [Clostridia bacterium]